MSKQTLAVLDDTFTIHSLNVDSGIPAAVLKAPMYFIGKTADELSIVLPASISLDSDDSDEDWRVLEVLGPLQLSLVGIMAQIGNVLANAKISIFVVSTFETDYFLVKQKDLDNAINALQLDGYKIKQ